MDLRKVYYALSPRLRLAVRRWYYLPRDIFDSLTGKRQERIPPRGKIFTGPGDFVKQGRELMDQLIRLTDLKPDENILDVGCGIGRLSIPLTAYLKEGSYTGFDIVEDGIRWCRKNITPRYPNFVFEYIPLRNDLYNLNAGDAAENFNFPYDDNMYDKVVLTSVFTHMQPPAVRNYLNEIRRVMKPGGTCFATFFLIDEENLQLMNRKNDPFFKYKQEGYWLHHKKVRDANIAYELDYLNEMTRDAGLMIERIEKGRWPGWEAGEFGNFQDIVLLNSKF